MENEPNAIQNPSQFPYSLPSQMPLPNATAVLVLGITSIPTCFCAGIVGFVLSIIALVLASKDTSRYNANPNQYTLSSLNNLKAGKVCSIIGLCFSSLYLIYLVCVIIVAVMSGSSHVDYYPGMY